MSASVLPKLTVGVWLEHEWSPEEGGGYTFHRALVEAIDCHEFAKANFVFVTACRKPPKLSKPVIRICCDEEDEPDALGVADKAKRPFPLGFTVGFLKRICKRLIAFVPYTLTNYLKRLVYGPNRPKATRVACIHDALVDLIRTKRVDVFYFPIPQHEPVNFEECISEIPYIASLWDIGHASTFSFPEFTYEGSWSWRDSWCRKIMGQALFVFCESEAGKQEALNYLRLHPESVGVVPFFLSSSLPRQSSGDSDRTILQSMGVKPRNYFFYPAQFWPHKNHYALLKAFAAVSSERPDLQLVLTGAEKGNWTHVADLAQSLGVASRVVFPGFVEHEKVAALYRNAIALVMPTFLGPTNLPLLEAMHYGCPVICSDLPGHREMLGDAALYVDPADHASLTSAIAALLEGETRGKQCALLTQRRSASRFTAESAMDAMDKLFCRVEAIRRCWA